MTRESSRLRRAAVPVIPALLCLAVVVQTGWFRNSSSITYDETFFLGAGIRTLHAGRLVSDVSAHGVAPLPILIQSLPAAWWQEAPHRSEAWKGVGDRQLIAVPRLLTTLTTLVPLIAVAFAWLHARRGPLAATMGAGLLAFSPSLLAHASLATSDASFAFLSTLAAITIGRSLASRSTSHLVVAAMATGLAFSAKYTGALLFPCFVIGRLASLVREPRSGDRGPRMARTAGEVAAFLTVAFATAWACHGFQVDPGRRLFGLPVPSFVGAFELQILHAKLGHPAFYLGEHSLRGWRSYHAFTMLVKSTLPELALAAAGLCLAARGRLRVDDRERTALLVFVALLSVALIRSPISIGHRYTLALYPPIVLLSVDALAGAIASRPTRRFWGTAIVCGQAATSLLAAPDYLAYFNPIAGRPEDAWRLLADSNVDWGQDLPTLNRLIEHQGLRRVAFDYFGTASPMEYGIDADAPASLRRPVEEYDALAVSVTKLHSIYPRQGESRRDPADLYRELRKVAPDYRAGRSILVYNLRRPEIRAAFLASLEAARKPPATQAAARDSRLTR